MWAKKKNWKKKKKKNFASQVGLEPTINYYKVQSKFYFLNEKNILLQLASSTF